MVWTSEKNGKWKTTTKNVKSQVKKNLQKKGYDWVELKRKAWEDRDKWWHICNRPSKRKTC